MREPRGQGGFRIPDSNEPKGPGDRTGESSGEKTDGAGRTTGGTGGQAQPPPITGSQPAGTGAEATPVAYEKLRPWLERGVIVPTQAPEHRNYGPMMVGPGVVVHSAEEVIEWARSHSLWMLMFGLACCAIEMMATNASRFDLDRFGVMPRGSPRQSDLLVVSGTVTYKVAPMVERVHAQMSEPKWVIAMGNCATAGSLYYHDGYSVVKGVDQIVPVDVYVSGCPPRPEALIDGIVELERLIRGEEPREGRHGRS